jgi:O-antigen/teichoic acid export membrane protein
LAVFEIVAATKAPIGLKSRFKEAAFWGISGAVVSRAFNMLAWVACARILGKVAFGQLSMVQSTTGVFGVFAGMGLGLTATKYIAELRNSDPIRAGRILGLAQLAAIAGGLLISSVLIALSHFVATRTLAEPGLALPLAIGSGLVMFGALNGFQIGALAGFEAFRTIAKVNIWAGLLSFPCIVGGAWLAQVRGAVAGLVLALAANWFLNEIALRRECRSARITLTIAGGLKELPVLMHFSVPALLASALVSPAMWVCNAWLIRQPNGYAELGVYAAADRWRLAILFIPASIAGPVLSMLSNLRGDGNAGSFKRLFRTNLALTVGLVTLLSIVIGSSAPLVMRLFGTGYLNGSRVLAVLACSAIAESLNTFLGQPLVTHSMWKRFWFDALLITTLLTSGWFLIPRWKGVGLAAAYGLAFTLTSLLLLVYQRKQVFTK